MPIFFIKNNTTKSKIGVWKVTETTQYLYRQVQSIYKKISINLDVKNELLKKQRLAILLLLYSMTGNTYALKKTKNGKPFIRKESSEENQDFISLSHSGNYVAVIIDKKEDVGIDIQVVNPRIERIAPKFIDAKTLSSEFESNLINKIHVYWCVKESAYKIYGKGNLNFIENIHIKPFQYCDNGEVSCIININSFYGKYKFKYLKMNNFMLTYSL